MKINLKTHTKIALGYFLIVTLLGLLLRLFFVADLPKGFNFNNFLHAHSHVALLGWIYMGLMTLIYKLFLYGSVKSKSYQWIFILTNISVLGMLFSFPFQGYALYSISFSTLYLISSYVFSWFIIKHIPEEFKVKKSWTLIKTGLFYLIFSSLGTWGVGPIAAMFGVNSFWFKDVLYFFLHFLYSGFFFVTLIGILFYILEKRGVQFEDKQFYNFYNYLNLGITLSYFLSVLWSKPLSVFYFLGGIGGAYQVYGYYLLYRLIKPHFKVLKTELNTYAYTLFKISVVLVGIRIMLQLLSVIPYFAELAFKFRDFIIGYLHFVFLGIIIPAIVVLLDHFKLLKLSKTALNLFLFTVAATEILIFYRAAAFWLRLPIMNIKLFNEILFVVSILFPISVVWIFMANHHSESRLG